MNRTDNLPSMEAIYIAKHTPEVIYGYVRAYRNGEVGFSVLDEATSKPDFSNCGVFRVKPKDFFVVFDYYAPMRLSPGIC